MRFKVVLKRLEGVGLSDVENKCGLTTIYLDDLLYKPKESKKHLKNLLS